MSDTGAQPPEQERQERQEAHQALVRDYKRLASREDFQRVMADLRKKFGAERTSYVYGCTPGDHAFRSGMKEPFREIERMTALELRPLGVKPKPAKAKSVLAQNR